MSRLPRPIRVAALAAAAFVLVPLAVGCGSAPGRLPPSAPSPLSGGPLPEFRRPDLATGTVDTTLLRGRVVVVKFFAKYCAPCARTLPAAERLHREHPEVSFVGVSEDDTEADALAVTRAHGLTFPVVLDRGHALAGRFRVGDLPAAFVADAEGRIRYVAGPASPEGDLEAALRALAPR